jgi:hypothetical protein
LQQLQGQLLSAHAHRQQIESQLETESQELQRTQNALEEALRESAAASAIEQHVKSKLATVQQTVSLKKLQLDEQHNAAARERALLEQQLLQKEESLQEAQTKVAELLQRYVPPCFSLAIQTFTTAPLHMLITDVFLSRRSTPKKQKRSRCHQAPTSARLSSLTNRKHLLQV